MSVQSEIDRIKANVSSTYSVLESAGAEMPTEQSSDNLPGTASSITAVLYGKAQSLTDAQKARARANIAALGKTDISLGIASDGLIYIFVNGEPVGTGIPQGQSGDVFGYVDENNTIVLNGNLADGTYTVKYEMENGDIVDIGNMVLDSNVYYSVTSNLTNCTNSNSTKTVVEGESYSATISANSGYELKSVTVTMGGAAVTVTNGVINIASVTGDIVITAVAEEATVEIVNQIPLSTDASGNPFNDGQGWKTGYRLSGSSGNESEQAGTEVTGFIPIKNGDTMYIKNIADSDMSHVVGFYDSSRAKVFTLTWSVICSGMNISVDGRLMVFTLGEGNVVNANIANVAYIRVSASEITNDSIITINEPIV